MLSNLFGEGVLSASFVTVYAKLRAKQEDQEAEHVAAAVFGVLSVVCAALVLVGVLASPLLVDVIASGFPPEKREVTVQLVRILFPATGMMVMSAWCLGVLNSHRRFLLSYTAPVALNAVTILCLLSFGPRSQQQNLATYLAWANVLGAVLVFLIQLPQVLRYLPGFRPSLNFQSPNVRTVLTNFGPVFLGRGVVQLSATIDSAIASWLPQGAVADLAYAQAISILPISLFSMSVSAAELPALSSAVGADEEVAQFLRTRLIAGLRRIAFFIVPSAVAFLLIGDVLAAALYQSGRFPHTAAIHVWGILAGSAVGLLASAMGRLYSSAYYALLDTKTPLKFATIRVVLTVALGILFALPMPYWLGIDPKWGAAGLTASAGIAGWVEFTLLRRGLAARIGAVSIPSDFVAKLWSVAFVAGSAAYVIKLGLGTAYPRLLAAVAIPLFGAIYFYGTSLLDVAESRAILHSALHRFRGFNRHP
jgi:putative peptidoglycan lipid II flippase